MFSKLRRAFIGVVVASFALAGTAYAAPAADDGTGDQVRSLGQVTAIGSTDFTLLTRKGETLTITVSASTTFKDKAGNAKSFTDLVVGSRVADVALKQADGTLLAETVVIFPHRTHYKGNGQITGVGEDEFDFTSRRGKKWEFYVDAGTAITDRSGATLALADLKAGMKAHVEAELRSDGRWWATLIRVLKPK